MRRFLNEICAFCIMRLVCYKMEVNFDKNACEKYS